MRARFGVESPVEVLAPTLYVDVALQPDAELIVDDEHAERACYVVSGAIEIDGAGYIEGQFVVLVRDVPVTVRALENSRVLLTGGAPLDGARHIWWNFVSSSRERIDIAKRDWREFRFAAVPAILKEFRCRSESVRAAQARVLPQRCLTQFLALHHRRALMLKCRRVSLAPENHHGIAVTNRPRKSAGS